MFILACPVTIWDKQFFGLRRWHCHHALSNGSSKLLYIHVLCYRKDKFPIGPVYCLQSWELVWKIESTTDVTDMFKKKSPGPMSRSAFEMLVLSSRFSALQILNNYCWSVFSSRFFVICSPFPIFTQRAQRLFLTTFMEMFLQIMSRTFILL